MDRIDELARDTADRLFEDLRDRHTLKWIFSKRQTRICDHLDSINQSVQREIHEAWEKLFAQALRAERLRALEEAAKVADKERAAWARPGGCDRSSSLHRDGGKTASVAIAAGIRALAQAAPKPEKE